MSARAESAGVVRATFLRESDSAAETGDGGSRSESPVEDFEEM
jgi:hypothetical protein